MNGTQTLIPKPESNNTSGVVQWAKLPLAEVRVAYQKASFQGSTQPQRLNLEKQSWTQECASLVCCLGNVMQSAFDWPCRLQGAGSCWYGLAKMTSKPGTQPWTHWTRPAGGKPKDALHMHRGQQASPGESVLNQGSRDRNSSRMGQS